ncbi:hypothetical protein D3C78_1874370 [compost metagenome]
MSSENIRLIIGDSARNLVQNLVVDFRVQLINQRVKNDFRHLFFIVLSHIKRLYNTIVKLCIFSIEIYVTVCCESV